MTSQRVNNLKVQYNYLQEWSLKLFPEMPDPELIAEYKALELEAQKDPKAASTPEMKESLEKARSELESRIRTREETLQSEAKMRQLEQHINHLMVSELAEDIASKERFYQRWNL